MGCALIFEVAETSPATTLLKLLKIDRSRYAYPN
jgi:hypothetical protein